MGIDLIMERAIFEIRDSEKIIINSLDRIRRGYSLANPNHAFYFCLKLGLNQLEKDNKKKDDVVGELINEVNIKFLRYSNRKLSDFRYNAHFLFNQKQSQLKLIANGSDIKTIWQSHLKILSLQDFNNKVNQKEWNDFKKIKIANYKLLIDFVKMFIQDRKMPKKFVIEYGFDLFFKQSKIYNIDKVEYRFNKTELDNIDMEKIEDKHE